MNAGTPFAARFAESGEGWVEARQYLWVVVPAPVATMVCSTILMAMRSPGEKHDGLGELAAALDDVVRERLPAELAVGVCGVLAHREGGVEQKDPLPGPVAEVARRRRVASEVCHKLLVDVAQAWRKPLVPVDREGEAHRLSRAVVGVLPKDDRAHVLGRGPGQRVQDVLLGRVDDLLVAHLLDLLQQLLGRARDVLGGIAQPGVHVAIHFHGRWSVLFAGVR